MTAQPPIEDGEEAASALLLHRSRGLHAGHGGPVVLGLLNFDTNIDIQYSFLVKSACFIL